jgi:hypothetical protein
MKELYTFRINGDIATPGKPGVIRLHVSFEDTEIFVFECKTNTSNEKDVISLAQALRSRFPITMPGHFDRKGFKQEIVWPTKEEK